MDSSMRLSVLSRDEKSIECGGCFLLVAGTCCLLSVTASSDYGNKTQSLINIPIFTLMTLYTLFTYTAESIRQKSTEYIL